MARAQYAPEVKAACLAALLAGQGVGEVAAQYKVPEATLRSWKSRQAQAQPRGEAAATAPEDQRGLIGELLIGYLAELLRTLKAQLEVYGDKDWLKKQSASDAAVLHGVLADKGFRLLEAFEAARIAEGDDPDAEVRMAEVQPVAGLLPESPRVGV
jgi:hypothetical protein